MSTPCRTLVAIAASVLVSFAGVTAVAAKDQKPAVQQFPRSPAVDPAAHDRGRALWAIQCVGCHGTQARGSDTGPNIIRTKTVNFDRSARPPAACWAVPQGGPSDAERQGQRELHGRGDRRPGQLPTPARERHDARRPCSPSPTSWSATRRPAKPISTAPAAAPPVTRHHPQPRRHTRTVALDRRSSAADALPDAPAAAPTTRNAVTVTDHAGGGTAALWRAGRAERLLRDAAAGGRHDPRGPDDRRQVVTNNPLQAHIDLLDRIATSRFMTWSPTWRR